MSHLYKEPRICPCGYTTSHRSNFATHKRICKMRPVEQGGETEQLRERVVSLEQQLVVKDIQLQAKDEQLLAKDEHYQRELHTKDQRIANLEQAVAQQLAETKEELKRTRKRKDNYDVKTKGRKTRTELERRKVAMRQNWMCANPDGTCPLRGMLQEYDVDHIIPLWNGGSEEPNNLQALCPACHRRKTADETEERNAAARSRCIAVSTVQ